MVRGAIAPAEIFAERAEETPSFEKIYEHEFDFVWRVAQRLGVRAGIDDVVQEVFLTVHRRLPEFENRSSIRTWIFSIARRIVATQLRSGRRRKEGLDRLSDQAPSPAQPDPEDQAARSEAAQLLEAILDNLDENKREVFILAELEHMSIGEVAIALEINQHTAQWRLKAARKEIEQAIERLRAIQRREAT